MIPLFPFAGDIGFRTTGISWSLPDFTRPRFWGTKCKWTNCKTTSGN